MPFVISRLGTVGKPERVVAGQDHLGLQRAVIQDIVQTLTAGKAKGAPVAQGHLLDVCEGYTAGIASLAPVGRDVIRRGGAHACFSGLPIPPFNAIHAWSDQGEIEDDLRALVAIGADRGLPMAICAPVGAPHENRVTQTASDLGFTDAGEPQAAMMFLDGDAPPRPTEVTCSSPADTADLAVVAGLMAEVFGLPPDVSRAAVDPATLDWDDLEWFTLRVDDTPVATSMLLQVGEVANVFNVAVPIAHRRNGFGAAATWEVIRRGQKRGAARTALLASHMGEPIYARMGFDVVGHVRTMMRT